MHVKRLITQFAPNYPHTLTAHPLPPSDSEGSKLYSQIFPCKNVGVTFTTLSNHLTDYPTLHSSPGLPTLQELLFLKNTNADCRKANGIWKLGLQLRVCTIIHCKTVNAARYAHFLFVYFGPWKWVLPFSRDYWVIIKSMILHYQWRHSVPPFQFYFHFWARKCNT